MNILRNASPGTKAALLYITVGALLMVWTVVWYVYLQNNPASSQVTYYVCAGMFVSGLILLGIGLAVGRIGQSAREADQSTQATIIPGANGAPAATLVATNTKPERVVVEKRNEVLTPAGQRSY